jgi:hypothetical protein
MELIEKLRVYPNQMPKLRYLDEALNLDPE